MRIAWDTTNLQIPATLLSIALLALALTTPASAIDVTWDGGGADNLWSNPLNWDTDSVPGAFDRAIFNATSTKDADITATISIFDLVIEAGYTGTVRTTSSAVFMDLAGSFEQAGGTFNGGGNIEIAGDLIQTGGVYDRNSSTIVHGTADLVAGDFSVQSTLQSTSLALFNGSTVELGNLSCTGNVEIHAGDVTVNTNLITFGNFLFTGGTLEADDWLARGDVIRTGGTLVGTQTELIFQSSAPLFETGPGGISIRTIEFERGVGIPPLALNGDLTVTWFYAIDSGDVVHTGNLTMDSATFQVGASDTLTQDGTITFVDGGTFRNFGTLELLSGSILDATAAATYTNNRTVIEDGAIFRNANGAAFTDSSGSLVTTVAAGDDLYVRLTDDDENLEGTAIDSGVLVTVTSLITGDVETLTLTETDNNGATFTNSTGFPTANGPAVIGDGILQQDGVENLELSYVDDEDPADTVTVVLQVPPVIWDGGGADNLWSNPLNWSTDTVPGGFDRVIFDATSTKDADISATISIFDLVIEAGYTGTIRTTSSAVFMNLAGSFEQAGGTFNGGGNVEIASDLIQTGGVYDRNSSTIVHGTADLVAGDFSLQSTLQSTHLVLFNGSTVELGNLSCTGDVEIHAGDVTVNNNLITFGDFLFTGGTLEADDWQARGNVVRTGGTLIGTQTELVLQSTAPLFETGPGGISIRTVEFERAVGVPPLALNGDLTVTWFYAIDSGDVVHTGNLTMDSATFQVGASDTLTQDGTITFVDGGTFRNFGTLELLPGSILDATAAATYTNNRTVIEDGAIFRNANGAAFTDFSGSLVTTVAAGDDLYVRLTDDDENLDGTAADTGVLVTVTSLITGDVETLTLTETDDNGATFANSAGFPTASGSAVIGDGFLQHDGLENLELSYVDDEDPADTVTAVLQVPPVIWDGGGADNLWSNPLNWSTDTVPGGFDLVIFDATSTKDADISATISIFDLVIEAGYTGTIRTTSSAVFMNLAGSFEQAGGTFNGGGNIEIASDLIQTGGVYDRNSSTIVHGTADLIAGDFSVQSTLQSTHLALFNGSTVELGNLSCTGDVEIHAGDVTVNNNLITFGDFLFTGGTLEADDWLARGEVIRTGGTLIGTQTELVFQSTAPLFETGPGGISIRTVEFERAVAVPPLALNGDLTVTWFYAIDSGDIVHNGNLTMDSGTFQVGSSDTLTQDGTITFVDGGTFRNFGTIELLPGSILDATAAATYTNNRTVIEDGVLLRSCGGISGTDATGVPINSLLLGDPLFVSVADEDANLDGTTPDSVTATVTNLANSDVEELTLTETSNLSGLFRNTVGFATSGGVGTPGNGIVEGQVGDLFELRYQDPQHGADVCSIFLVATSGDCNDNGTPDDADIAAGTSLDCNNNGVPDECEPDCNSTGIPDDCDVNAGTSLDCNGNGYPDDCEIAQGIALDCDQNGIPDDCQPDCDQDGIPDACDSMVDCNSNGISDDCDIATGFSSDSNANGIPDECDADCNGNGVEDSIDIAGGISLDCNMNDVPDECEVDAANDCNLNGIPDECEPDCNNNGLPDDCDLNVNQTSLDCNMNGVPDECDTLTGTSLDCNSNGTPDECETDCNGNQIPDDCDIASGQSPDCNENGIPDSCDIAGPSLDCDTNGVPDECQEDCNANGVPDACDLLTGAFEDCNMNGVLDQCDIGSGASLDCNGNGIPDECEMDCNGNGTPDDCDVLTGASPDCNQNGSPDECDISTGFSVDCNSDGIPDECEGNLGNDCNNNGNPDDCDIANFLALDCNSNGIPDSCEVDPITGGAPDCNNNGVPDECEVDCNNNGNPDECDITNGLAQDCNFNGIPDQCELADGTAFDCNGNGVLDSCDLLAVTSLDCNMNNVPDECDTATGSSNDCNGNDIPDECELDCNANGVPDACDVLFGTSADCDTNGIPDECDIASGTPDCNANGVPDSCDVTLGDSFDCNMNGVPDDCDVLTTSQDCDMNGVPDECDFDCNNNGTPDSCDIAAGTSQDCNNNTIPDECELVADCNMNGVLDECEPDCNFNGIPDDCDIAAGTSVDCNVNGVPDSCDIAVGTSLDCNSNGIADECETDCNGNGVPDDCDITAATSGDCNGNGVPDECDISAGTSTDTNGNGIPDECEDGRFIRGDCNADGSYSLADAVAVLAYLFPNNGSFMPRFCDDACDVNDDEKLDVADAVSTLLGLFGDNIVLPSTPFPSCGFDPAGTALGCDLYDVCP